MSHIWRNFFTSDLRISSSFFTYFLDFLFFKNFKFEFQNSSILEFGPPDSVAFQQILEKFDEFVNPGWRRVIILLLLRAVAPELW
jgi:hypothetical protein